MDKMEAIGMKVWTFSAGHIPLVSTGREPEFTSHDKIAIMNFTMRDAEVELEIFYEAQAPVKYKKLKVLSRRVRKIRMNDLIDPIPVPLDLPYGFIVRSSEPVVIQFSRMNTGSERLAGICTIAYPSRNE